MRSNLSQFDRKTYEATAKVNTRQAQRNVRGLGDVLGGYFTKVSQRAFRTSLVRMAAFRTTGAAAISGIVPVIASATAAAGGLASAFGVAGAGAAAFGAVAVPMFDRVSTAAGEGAAAVNELPAALQEAGHDMRSLNRTVEELRAATRGPIGVAFSEWLDAATRGLPLITPLVNSTADALARMGQNVHEAFETQGFRDFITFLSDNVGPVMDQLYIIVENLAIGIAGLMQAFMPLGQGLLESIADGMRRFAQWAQSLGQSEGFQEFMEYARESLPVVWDLIVNATGAFIAFGKALDTIGLNVAKGLSALFESIKNMDPAVLGAVAVGLSAVITAIGVGLGPGAIAVAAGVGALVGALSNLEGGVSSLSGPLRQIATFFTDLWREIKEVARGIWDSIQPALQELWTSIKTQLAPAFGDFLDAIKPIARWFISVLGPVISQVLGNVIGIIKGFVTFLTGIFQLVTGILTGEWSKAWQGIQNIFSGAIQAIWNLLQLWVIGRIVKLFRSGLSLLRSAWSSAWSWMRTFFSGILSRIVSTFNSSWRTLRNFFVGAITAFTTFWRDQWNGVVDWFSSILNGLVGIAEGIMDSVVNAFKTGINAVTGFINKWFLHPLNNVLGVFGLEIPDIPQLATGGKLTQEVEYHATGGQIGGGFKTNKPTAIVGEGNTSSPEYVIPTDRKHRGRARALHAEAGKQLMASGGVVGQQPQMMQEGGILDWLGDAGGAVWQGIKSVGEGVAWLGQKSWDLIKNGAAWMMDNTIGPIVDKVKSVLPENILGDISRGAIDKAYGGIRDFLGEKEEEVKQAGEQAREQQSASVAGARPAEQWRPVVERALGMLGMPMSWTGRTLRQIQIESGGNPNAQNNWDINAQMGVPSQGLLQTIPPTFQAHSVPGFNNIKAPLDNIMAALNYTVSRYGSIPNIWPTTAGYDNGGALQPGWNMAYNGTGRTENVQSPASEDAMLRKLDRIAQLLQTQEPVNFNFDKADPDTVGEFMDRVETRLRHRQKEGA